ncbi:MAG: hypothetical protein ACRDM7_22495 [Thermoleophilaceae bacterium]
MTSHPRWAQPVKPESWRSPPGRSREEVIAEQDRTAGGRHRRLVALPNDRRARASIELKQVRGNRRVYAYLRYSASGETVTKYVGEALGATREARLRAAWKMARAKDLLGPHGD